MRRARWPFISSAVFLLAACSGNVPVEAPEARASNGSCRCEDHPAPGFIQCHADGDRARMADNLVAQSRKAGWNVQEPYEFHGFTRVDIRQKTDASYEHSEVRQFGDVPVTLSTHYEEWWIVEYALKNRTISINTSRLVEKQECVMSEGSFIVPEGETLHHGDLYVFAGGGPAYIGGDRSGCSDERRQGSYGEPDLTRAAIALLGCR